MLEEINIIFRETVNMSVWGLKKMQRHFEVA